MMKGYIHGLLASASFGLIPLFTLPLLARGMAFDTIIFYRFLIAGLTVGTILVLRRQPLHVTSRQLRSLALLSCMYASSAMLLLWGFSYLSSGIATTIHFLYPVFVAVIMMLFFREPKSGMTFLAIGLACGGVALLSSGGDSAKELSLFGVGIVLLSALANALYIVGMSRSRARVLGGLRMSFYVLLFGSLIALCNTLLWGQFRLVTDPTEIALVLLLAIVTAVVSNLFLISSVKLVGSTPAAVLGAMEPVTAVCVGILVFGEPLTLGLLLGMLLIIGAVCLIVLHKPGKKA